MSIKTLFRQRSDTIESLQKKYRDIESQKKSLETKADDLRSQSLKSDIDVTQEIQEIKEEILLADIAMKETKAALEKMLENKIASDFEKLPEQLLEFETKLADLSTQAGQELGQAIKTLQATNLSFATTLGRFIREQVIDFSNDHRRQNQMKEFLIGYGNSINSQSDTQNFRDWKKQLARIEKLQPGSPAAVNHIRAEVEGLLRSSATVANSENIAWMFSGARNSS